MREGAVSFYEQRHACAPFSERLFVTVDTDETFISSCIIANLCSSQLIFLWFSESIV